MVQVDSVLSRLTALKDKIEGTEALIEIDLDHRRNELVAFDLVSHLQTVFSSMLANETTLLVRYQWTCLHDLGKAAAWPSNAACLEQNVV